MKKIINLFKKKQYRIWAEEFGGSTGYDCEKNFNRAYEEYKFSFRKLDIISTSLCQGHSSYGNETPLIFIVIFKGTL